MSFTNQLIRAFNTDTDIAESVATKIVADHTAGTAGDGEVAIGISKRASANYRVEVVLNGTAQAVSGGAFSAGASLQSDANGKLITKKTAGVAVAIALQEATAADEIVEVLLS